MRWAGRWGRLVVLAVMLAATLRPGEAAAQYDPPRQIVTSPGGVNLADGRFTYQATDLSIGPLTLERNYLGGQTVEGSNYFGRNWTHNYAFYVSEGEVGRTDQTLVVLGRTSVHFTRSLFAFAYIGYNPDAFGTTLELVDGSTLAAARAIVGDDNPSGHVC